MKPLRALIASIAAVGAGTGLVFALRPVAPDLSLGVLYVLPVMAVAVAYGVAYAAGTAVASMLAFNFFFLPPSTTSRCVCRRTGSRSVSISGRPSCPAK